MKVYRRQLATVKTQCFPLLEILSSLRSPGKQYRVILRSRTRPKRPPAFNLLRSSYFAMPSKACDESRLDPSQPD